MNSRAKQSPANTLAMASLLMMLNPSLPASAQVLPEARQIEGPTPVRNVQVARSVPINRSVIQGDNLTSGQLNQIFGSGPRTFVLQTNTPITGDVVIPRGITVINNINSANAALNVQGNLVDSGRLIFRSADPSALQATLNANNVTVNPGGLIAALGQLSLNINAGNIVNAGTISAGGNLNLNATGSIVNALPQGFNGTQPVMQAMQNINMLTGTGHITNAGMINAGTNVNINALTATQSINLNNILGTIKAGNEINVRDASYTGAANIDIRGGNLLSQVLNLNSGKGTIDVFADNITGVVNASACNAHIGAFHADNLRLGNLNVSGDPTYFNTGGDVTISGTIDTNGADLAILASENVKIDGGGLVKTEGAAASGNLLIVAGGNLSGAGAGQVGPDNSTVITISNGPGSGGGSPTGGHIDMIASTGIATFSNASSVDGGSVQLIAYSGSHPDGLSGTIDLGTNIIDTAAFDGKAGSVTIIAGASSGTAINTGDINTFGNAGGGSVTISTANPTITGGNISVLDGTASGGIFIANTIQPSSIVINSVNTTDFVQVVAGSDISIKNAGITNGGAVALIAGGNVQTDALITTGNGDGGSVFIAAGAAVSFATGIPQFANGAGTGGGSPAGGSITMSSGVNTIDTRGVSAATTGGNITLLAYEGGGSNGNVTITGPVLAGGTGTGTNGFFAILAGGSSTVGDIDVSGSTKATASGVILISAATADISGGVISVTNGIPGGGILNAKSYVSKPITTTGNLLTNSAGVQLATGGNITIGGDITTTSVVSSLGSGGIALLAGGNIDTAAGGSPFTFETGDGFHGSGITGTIAVIAGAQVDADSNLAKVKVSGASASGGSINFDTVNGGATSAGALLQSQGSCCGGTNSSERGGTVTLIAFADAASNNGLVNLLTGTTAVDSHSPANIRNSGSIVITAGGKGTAITSGDLLTHFGAPGTGAVTINAAQPVVPGGGIFYSAAQNSTAYQVGTLKGAISLESIDAANSIAINAGQSITISGKTNVSALGNAGTNISISAGTTLSVPGGTAGEISTGSFTIAGILNLTANDIVVTGGTDPLLLTANGASSSDGGTVNITQLSTNTLTIGSQATGNNIQISALSGTTGGAGGKINLAANGNIKVDPAAISADPNSAGNGKGATYVFSAVNSNLQIDGSLIADGSKTGDGGSIALNSGSSSAFTVGGSSGNYINGTLSAQAGGTGGGAGGSVTITNTGTGGITLSDPADITVAPQISGNGGSIDLEATGGPLTLGIGTLSADSLGGTGGLVKLVGASLSLPTTGGGFDATANTGSVILSTSSATPTTVNAVNSFTGKDVAVIATNSGFVLGANTVTGSNSVALITKDSITASSLNGINPTPTLVLVSTGGDVGTSSARLVIDAPNMTAQSNKGDVYIQNVSTGDGSGNVNLVNSIVDGTSYTNSATNTYSLIASGISTGKDLVSGATVPITANKIDLTSSGGFGLSGNLAGLNFVGLVSTDSVLTGDIGPMATLNLLVAATGLGEKIGSNDFFRLVINAPNVTLSATKGSVFVDNVSLGDVNGDISLIDGSVNGSNFQNSAQNSYSFVASSVTNSLKSSKTIGANSVILYSKNGIDLSGATVNAKFQAAFITTGATGSIISIGTTTTASLTLSSLTDIGSSGSRLQVSAENLTAKSLNGSVFINNNSNGDIFGNVNLVDSTVEGFTRSNSAFDTYSVDAVGIASGKVLLVPFSSSLTANNVDLTSTGEIALVGPVTAPSSLALISAGSIFSGPTLNTNGTLTLAVTGAGSSIGSSGSRVMVNAPQLTLSSTSGSVFVTNNSSGDFFGDIHLKNTVVNGASYSNQAASGTYSLDCPFITSGDNVITVFGTDISGKDVDLKTAGGFQLGGSVTGTKSVALIASSSITTLNGLSAPSVTLASNNSLGIDADNRLVISAANLTAQAGAGGVFITNSSTGDVNGNVNLVDSVVNGTPYTNTALGKYSVRATSIASGKNLTSSKAISAMDIVLSSSGGFALGAALSATNSIALIANDSISSASINGLSASHVILAANGTNANIGSSSSRLLLNSQNVTASAAGSVFITDNFSGGDITLLSKSVEGSFYSNSAVSTYSFKASNLSGANKLATAPGDNIFASDIALTTSAGFNFNSSLNGTNSVALISNDAITSIPFIGTKSLTLVTTDPLGASIGTNDVLTLNVDVANLTAQSTKSVFISNTFGSDVSLVNATVDGTSYTNSAKDTYSLQVPYSSSFFQQIKSAVGADISADVVEIRSGNGLALNGAITGVTKVGLVCNESILTLGNVTAPAVVLAVLSNNSTIGSSASSRLSISAKDLTLAAPQGSVFVTDTFSGGTVTLVNGVVQGLPYTNGASPTSGTYDLITSNDSLSTGAGTLAARDISLAVTAPTKTLTIQGANLTALNLTLSAPDGTLTVTDNVVVSTPFAGGSGGTINVSADLINGGAGPIQFSAKGDVTGVGDGGTISINHTQLVTLANSAGGLTFTVNAGQNVLSNGKAGTVSVNSSTGISVDPAAFLGLSPGANGGSGAFISLTSQGTVNFPAGSTISVDGTGSGSGGNISITGDIVSFSGAQNLVLSANAGAGAGNGGNIQILTNNASSTINVISGGTGNVALSAKGGGTGGDGGIIGVFSGGDLTFNSTGVTADPNAASNGDGAHVSMSAKGTLTLANTSYIYNGEGDGDGGLIHFQGGSIATAGPTTLSARSSATGKGNGGLIDFFTGSGDVTIDLLSGLTMIANGGSPGSTAGDGGIVQVTTKGNIIINPADLRAGPLGNNGNGATFTLFGASVGTALGTRLNLSANGGGFNGAGTGDGGGITINQQSTTATSIGTLASDKYLLTASAGSGGGSGGYIDFVTGGSLKADPAAVVVTAQSPSGQLADGGSITLRAGQSITGGTLLVTGNLDVSSAGTNPASNGGFIFLQSNNKTPFSIKTGSTNGTKGTLTVNGNASHGSISITNLGGGVTDGQAAMTADSIDFGGNGPILVNGTLTANSVQLSAGGSGAVTASKTIKAGSIQADSGTGNISLSNIDVSIATDLSAFTGSSGTVTVTGKVVSPATAKALTISGASGKTVTIKTIGDLITSSAISGGTVTLESTSTTNGTVSINAPVNSTGTISIKAPGITLNNAITSTGNTTIAAKLGGITANATAVVSTGSLIAVPTASPLPLAKTDVLKAGSLTLTSTAGASSIQLKNGSSLTSNGAGITIKASGTLADVIIGNNTSITANGGAIAITSTGKTSIGSSTTQNILARSVNGGMGTVSITATNGIDLQNSSKVYANKNITLTASSATADFSIGDKAEVKAGFGGGTAAGGLTIAANRTGAKSFTTGSDVVLQANGGILKVASKGFLIIGDTNTLSGKGASSISTTGTDLFNIGDGTKITNDSGALTIKSGGALNVGAFPTGSVTVSSTGSSSSTLSITAASMLIGDASQFTATGKLAINNTGKFGFLRSGDNVQFTGGAVTIASALNGMTIGKSNTVTANAASAGNITISSSDASNAVSIQDGFNFQTTGNGNIAITSKSDMTIGVLAGIPGSKMVTTGKTGTIKISAPGVLMIGTGTLDSSAGSAITIGSSANALFLQNTTVKANSTATITGAQGVSISDSASITTTGNLTITATGTSGVGIGDGVTLTAGALKGKDPTAAFSPTLVQTKGSILITGASTVGAGNGNNWTSNGGDIKVIAKTGNMQVGGGGTVSNFTAFGGNIQFLAKGTVTGDKNNITAFGMGAATPLSNTGGGIEIGSGLISSSAITTALATKTVPLNNTAGITGTPAPIFLNTNGAIQVINKTGTASPIDLSGSTLKLNVAGAQGGAQVFDAMTSSSSVIMKNTVFTTSAFKPIAMTTVEGAVTLPPVAQSKRSKGESQIFASPRTRLMESASNAVKLIDGELFVCANTPVEVNTDHVDVLARKGALVAVRQFQGNTYVRSCSPSGTVNVKVGSKSVELNPGEEMMVTDHKPDASEIRPGDGLGRRRSHTVASGDKHITVSDFAIITMLSSSDSLAELVKSKNPKDKQLLGRMLKTAATIDVALKHRGAYNAQ